MSEATEFETSDDPETTIKTVEMQKLIEENAQLRADLNEISLKLATVREILYEFINKNYKS